jgi:hypothetical protein
MNLRPIVLLLLAGLAALLGAADARPMVASDTGPLVKLPAGENLLLGEASNLKVGTATGTKIGTATSQKLAFYNSTPIVQPSGAALTALGNLGLIASPTLAASDISSGTLATARGGTGISNAAGSLTFDGATTIGGGGTVTLGGFTLTVPATGTVALLGTGNVFTAAQTISHASGLALTSATGTTLTISSTNATAVSLAGGINGGAQHRVYYGGTNGAPASTSAFTFQASANLLTIGAPVAGTNPGTVFALNDGTAAGVNPQIGLLNSTASGDSRSGVLFASHPTNYALLFGNFAAFGPSTAGSSYGGTADAGKVAFYAQGSAVTRMLVGAYANVPLDLMTNNVVRMSFAAGGDATLSATTASTTKDTGGLVIEGGLGVEGAINNGGGISSSQAGASTWQNTSTGAGAVLNLRSASGSASVINLIVNGTVMSTFSATAGNAWYMSDGVNGHNPLLYNAGTTALCSFNYTGTLDATSASAASVVLAGGLGVGKALHAAGDGTFGGGELTLNGATTTTLSANSTSGFSAVIANASAASTGILQISTGGTGRYRFAGTTTELQFVDLTNSTTWAQYAPGVIGSASFNLLLTNNSASFTLAGGMQLATGKNLRIGTAAIATNATDGFLYVSTCAGTPTGTPTTLTGTAPIVIDTTNNKLYFYSGGAWRDAGP